MNRFAKAFVTTGILMASVLGANAAQAVGTTPTVSSVASTSASKTYAIGETVYITVNFSEPVDIHGWLALTLETGSTDRTIFCSNCSGNDSGVTSRIFKYVVQVGDRSSDLDYQSSGPMMFNGAGETVVAHTGGAALDLTFPAPGSPGSLSANSQIVIDGSGEDEQWQSPAGPVAGLHSFVMMEDLRENVSQLWSADSNWSWPSWQFCSASIMNVSASNGSATIVTVDRSVAAGFRVGDQISVSGVPNSLLSGTLNGTFTIAGISGRNINFALPGTLTSTALTSGTVKRDCSSRNVWYKSVLQPCINASDIDCIEGVYGQSSNSSEVSGVFDQLYPARGSLDFLPPSTGIPAGGTSSIFNFASLSHSHGSKYAVTVSLTGTKTETGVLSAPLFFASITPTEIVSTTCSASNTDGYCMDTASSGVAVDRDQGYRCIMWDNIDANNDAQITQDGVSGDVSTCAMKRPFPAGVKFRIKVRLSQTPSGWFHGRMSNPEISLETNSGVSTLSVKAGAVGVPTVGASGPFASLSQSVQNWFTQNCSQEPVQCGTRERNQDWSNSLYRNAEISPYPYSETSFTQFDMWKNFFNDSAGAVPSNWNVRTLAASEMGGASTCISNASGLTGIVTTNSTLYSQGPPTYNESTGTLDYKVASPHYKSDGSSEFLGDYHLLVREDVANCLYKFSGSEVTSTISVQAADGSAKTATTSLTKENGFYNFAATGFTFSTPTIKAKLQAVQAASAPATESKAPSATVPAVTVPAVTVPAATVPVIAVPAMTPKVGTPVIVSNPPAAQVAAGLGMSAEKTVVRTAIKVPVLVKGVGIKSYQVVLRSSTGKIVALQTIPNLVAGAVKTSQLTAPTSGNYKVEIVATTTKGIKLPKWTSPPIKLKK